MADFRAVMETNYFGVMRCIQAVLPSMRARGSGCIINIASVAGHISMSPMASYSASKFALEALSECLAQEVKAFGIRVAIVVLARSTTTRAAIASGRTSAWRPARCREHMNHG